jgi:hypothetical protein
MGGAIGRRVLQTATAGALVLVARMALAQWGPVVKWTFEAAGAIAAARGISQYVEKWFQDKRCSVSVDDLESLKLQCQTVGNSLDFDGAGVIPFLKVYLEKQDGLSWVRAKIALGTFFNNGNGLMSAINIIVQKLDANTYPGPQEDIKRLYQGVDQIRAAVAALASLPDTPEPETLKMASSILESISKLPSTARNAIVQLQAAVDDRRKVSC